jgi:hypothetical protein
MLALSSFSILLPGKSGALSGNEFNAARIIDDAVFFNPNTMNTGDIQNFLNAKVPTCDTYHTRSGSQNDPGPPYICLKDYSQSFNSVSADAYCGGITGGTKSAANIIFDVSQACGVNPQALVVLLQKEQSLVTDTWPWPIQYRSATGYGCPDTAACDSQYYGFFNQVYNAGRQFKRYVQQPHLFNYAVGRNSYIAYNPNGGCGGSNITIQTQATAALYNYTPYQPNQAALNNLYGTGDGCSAYGNRNFWRLFNDWFGSTLGGGSGLSKGISGDGGGNAASWSPGRLDLFIQGTNPSGVNMWHKWFDGTSWNGYEQDPANGETARVTSAVAGVSWGPERLDLFARSETGSLIHKQYHRYFGWTLWQDLGGCIVGAPTATSWQAYRIDVFVQGCNSEGINMHHKWFDGVWHAWEVVPAMNARISAAPSAVSWGPNRIDIFARSESGELIHNWYGGIWHGIDSQGGCIEGQPAASSWKPGRLDVFVKSCNSSGPNVSHKWYDNNVWHPWELTPRHENTRVTSMLGAVSWRPDRIDIFGRGEDATLMHQWYDGGWNSWESLSGGVAP